MEGGLDVPHALELAPHPGLLQTRLVLHRVDALGLRVPGGDLGVDGLDTDVVMTSSHFLMFSTHLRSQHGALHGGVSSLDLGDVHETRAASYETAAREGQLGDALEAAFIESSGTVTNPLSSLNYE